MIRNLKERKNRICYWTYRLVGNYLVSIEIKNEN